MKSFRKNVLRLAMRNKGAVIGAVLIIGIGIFVFVSMIDTLHNLDDQISAYYKESGMADVFAEVEGISSAELQRLTDIPGIRAAGKQNAAHEGIHRKSVERTGRHCDRKSSEPELYGRKKRVYAGASGAESVYQSGGVAYFSELS